ncbi:MAG: hypothetical protein KIS92_16185 [Planctomycetota bacterium]|nr:hypothetical protein [Planctomycetota bacterium]
MGDLRGPERVDISKLLEKAKEAAERRNYDYAIALYSQACELDPDSVPARRELRAVEIRVAKEKPPGMLAKAKLQLKVGQAHTMYTAKKYDAAIKAAEEALQIDPGHMGAQMVVGRSGSAAGYKNMAVAVFEDICAVKGGTDKKAYADALRELAYAYENTARVPEAMTRWEELRRLVPDDREATQKIRDLSATSMTKKIETAASGNVKGSIARSISKSTDEVQRLERDTQDIRTADDLKMAIKDTQDDIAKRPDDARLYGKLGDLFKRGEDYEKSKKAYEDARQRDPQNPQWKIIKLDDLEIWRMTKDINALAQKAKAGDAAARELYGKKRVELVEFKLTSFVEREKQYATDSRIKFELGGCYFDLAEVRKDNQLYDEAIKRYQFTFKDPKFRNESGLRMGTSFARKGQYELALKRFEETLATLEIKDDRWKNLMYARADTLELQGKLPDSLTMFLQIYEMDVAFKDVSKRVENLQKKTATAT